MQILRIITALNRAFLLQIFTALENHLIPSLTRSPPNVEAMRLYILLPELKILDQPDGYRKILIAFGDAILHLVPFAQNVLGELLISRQQYGRVADNLNAL